jgi:hypothetical protein
MKVVAFPLNEQIYEWHATKTITKSYKEGRARITRVMTPDLFQVYYNGGEFPADPLFDVTVEVRGLKNAMKKADELNQQHKAL